MIEFKSKKPKIAVLLNKQLEITFTADKHCLNELEELGDGDYTVSVKKFSNHRSTSQNSYLWALLSEIAVKINSTKIEVYKSYIRDYGVSEIVPIKDEAVEMFSYKWESKGLGWFTEDLGESKLNGYTKLIIYFGSSCYNSEEMSRVLDAVISDCEEMGISTLTLDEAMKLENEN